MSGFYDALKLDGVRAGINTVFFATPILGVSIAYVVGTTNPMGAGVIARGVGGALAAGLLAGTYEYTVGFQDPPEIKWEVILGSAGIGAGAGVLGPKIFG